MQACSEVAAGVRDAIEVTGASLLYLPPYSPDFNPIENAYAKHQGVDASKGRADRLRSLDAASSIVGLFTPIECANDFRAAGYEPD